MKDFFNPEATALVLNTGSTKGSGSGTLKKVMKKCRSCNDCKKEGLIEVQVCKGNILYANGSSLMEVKGDDIFVFAADGLNKEGCGGWLE